MHRFLTAFLCLSTLAMTQNVVAGTPTSLEANGVAVVAQGAAVGDWTAGPELASASFGGEVPTPGTMMLLVTGLAGLSAVGNRRAAPGEVARR